MPAGIEGSWVIEFAKAAGIPGLLILYMFLKDRAFVQGWRDQAKAVQALAENVGRLAGKIE